MILVIAYGIMKITKSLGVEMSYSMRRSCTKISCRERNKKNKNQNTQCLMRSLKKKFQRYHKIKMYNNKINRYSPSLYYLLLIDSGEPKCYEEEMQVDIKKKWEQGMKEEMDSLVNNQTWDLVQLPAGKRALQNKWVYKLKEEDGGKKWYKARLVVKGFAQKKGIDFDEIFSPVVKMTSIRTILSLVVVEYLHLEQLDVKTTFLHGDLEEEIYMQQPQGYEVKGKENLVCRLKKTFYGIKQAPRKWYLKFDRFMTEQGYSRCHSDHCVYFKNLENGSYIILLLYVDDMLVAGSNMQDINVLKKKLDNSFVMKDLGATKEILGMRITRDKEKMQIDIVSG
jgi:hypothetical protein